MCRYRASYHRRRRALIKRMGGKCVHCGVSRKLEFGHLPGTRKWVAAKKSRNVRIVLYERDFAAGVLQLQCRTSNASSKSFAAPVDESGSRSRAAHERR